MSPADTSRNKKRIIALFPDLLGVGGVQQAGRMTAQALAEIAPLHGWALEVFSLNDLRGVHRLPRKGTISFRGFDRNKLTFVMAAFSHAVAAKAGGIVLVGHPNLAPPAVWMRHFRPSLRNIVMTHGIDVWQTLSSSRQKALQAANRIVAPSTYTARKLVEVQGISDSKITRLPWPVNSSLLEIARQSATLPKPRDLPAGKIVLTVGRWAANEKYKGADHLIRAIADLRPSVSDFPEGVQLVAVGTGDDLPRLRSLAGELRVSDRVHFWEHLSDEQLAACYAHADIFALPSTKEGFGLVFLEAMAFGKPVVGAAAGGVTDIVRDGENGFLVPPDDPAELSQALRKLLRDPSLCEKLGKCAAQTVNRDYGFETFRGNLSRILDESLAAEGPA
jgi:phosphatidylinositol alpha-1,6-mannosyltransferase